MVLVLSGAEPIDGKDTKAEKVEPKKGKGEVYTTASGTKYHTETCRFAALTFVARLFRVNQSIAERGERSAQSGNIPSRRGGSVSRFRTVFGFFSGPPMTRTGIPFRSTSASTRLTSGS
jgi:hypothetical protein